MAKKIGSVLLIVCMLAGTLLTGCGTNKADNQSRETTKNTTEETSSQETNGDGKVLVVYYSATGSTKAVAEKIAEETNGELFELKPVEEHTDDDLNWSNDDSRVSKEHDDESLRDVELTEVTPDDFKNVKTVILGYPIWWGIAAWPVDNFVKDNDFTGKTVIPFCTSASSGIGDSGNLLEKMAGTGNWQEGKRFSSNASEKEIQEWVNSLNLK